MLLVGANLVLAQNVPHVRAQLIVEVSGYQPGESFNVLLHQDIDEGWHTYWQNPGDSGDPPTLSWEVPEGIEIGDFGWPIPERIAYGPLMNYGYHDQVYLPFTVSVDEGFNKPELTITGAGRILVCADICIPQKVEVTVTVLRGEGRIDASAASLFAAARAALPADARLPGELRVAGENLKLLIALPGMASNRIEAIEYFPIERDLIDNPSEQEFEVNENGLELTLVKGFLFDETQEPDLSGLLVVKETSGDVMLTSGFSVNASPGPAAVVTPAPAAEMSLLAAVLFAFLGGLILNLMPCVFPVLSIKILSLVDSAHSSGESVRLHGWVYAAGVILSFVAIALTLILLRSGGEALGWGFQLQSPIIVGLLTYLFLLIALNLFGLFEVGTSIMSLGSDSEQGGYAGSFGTGVLATIVAAPCTAPFMGAAVGYALTQSSVTALIIFAALGMGMATPYLALCYSPALLSRMPRPGAWMEKLRQLLAFPMLAAAIWLVWVLGVQVGETGMMQVLAGCLVLAFAVWLRAVYKPLVVQLLAGSLALLAIYIVVIQESEQAGAAPTDRDAVVAGAGYLDYSPSLVEEAVAQGPVLVNFTAAWCITCKVNEVNALDRASVKALMAEKGVTYIKADWTNEDPVITRALEAYGRSGVPLYLLYSQGAERAAVLPQLLTEDIVLKALDQL